MVYKKGSVTNDLIYKKGMKVKDLSPEIQDIVGEIINEIYHKEMAKGWVEKLFYSRRMTMDEIIKEAYYRLSEMQSVRVEAISEEGIADVSKAKYMKEIQSYYNKEWYNLNSEYKLNLIAGAFGVEIPSQDLVGMLKNYELFLEKMEDAPENNVEDGDISYTLGYGHTIVIYRDGDYVFKDKEDGYYDLVPGLEGGFTYDITTGILMLGGVPAREVTLSEKAAEKLLFLDIRENIDLNGIKEIIDGRTEDDITGEVEQYRDFDISWTQQQYDAVTSFTFNGGPSLQNSNKVKIFNFLKEGNYCNEDYDQEKLKNEAKEIFILYRNKGTLTEGGLIKRKLDEWEMFFEGDYKVDERLEEVAEIKAR